MALVYIRPDADIVDGSWVNESASNTNLYDSLNETSPIDTDFIRSSNLPANDIVTLRLSNFAGAVTEPMTVYYRYKAVSTSGDPLSLKVRLVQGAGGSPATTIAEWEHSDAAATYQDASQLLSTAQFNAITDFDDLFLEFEAITGLLQISALALLAGETDGFAVDATGLITPAYIGGPNGGCVAVIDTGTPANDLSDVPLDESNLVQTGTSPKMVLWNSAPYVRWTPHNLLTVNSETLSDNTSWVFGGGRGTGGANVTTAPSGASTADSYTAQAGTGRAFVGLNGGIALVSGFLYTWSIYVKKNTHRYIGVGIGDNVDSGIAVCVDLNDGSILLTNISVGSDDNYVSSSSTSVGDGWYRISVTFTVDAGGTNCIGFYELRPDGTNATWEPGLTSAAGTESIYVWGAQLNRGPVATPYLATTTAARIGIPQEYDTAASKFGILVEPACTNLITTSEDIQDNAEFDVARTSTTTNATTAPDGSTTADKLIDSDGTNDSHSIYRGGAAVGDGTYAVSIFVKAAEHGFFALTAYQTTNVWVTRVFSLTDGTVTDSAASAANFTNVSASSINVGNGWWRLILNYTHMVAGSSIYRFGLTNTGTPASYNSAGEPIYDGAANEGVYVWGAQWELSSVATSYIPTLGSTVTRAADNIIALSSSFPYGSANTAYVSAKAREVASQHDVLEFDANNANEDESVKLYTNATADILMQIEDGAATQLAPLDSAVNATANTTFQVTGAWDTNDVDVSANGTAAASDGTATMPTITHARLGCNPTPGNHLNGYIYKIVVVPRQIETATGDIENWRYA